jgi:putative transposase
MARSLVFSEGEYYHVFNRGIDKRDIFLDDSEKARFQKLMFLCNGNIPIDLRRIPSGVSAYDLDPGERLADVGAYALMSNHYHILAKERKQGGISRFMHKLGTSLTMFFNAKHDHKGRLLESTFKAVHATDDRHLEYLFAYIHLNPLAFLSREQLLKYRFSSLPEYTGDSREESKILTKSEFPQYFEQPSDHLKQLEDWYGYAEAKPPQEYE